MNTAASVYYWLAFAASLVCLLRVPSKMRGVENWFASLVLALFGFILWPLFVAAVIKTKKGQR